MSENIVIIGGGGHAKVVINIIKKLSQYNILGYFDNEDCGEILGVKYIGNDDFIEEYSAKVPFKFMAMGLGSIKVNTKRFELMKKMEELGFSFPPIISPTAIINEEVEIGEGTVVADGAIISTSTKIGRCCIINTGASIDHDCQIGDNVHIAPGAVLSGGVKMADNSMAGVGSILRQYLVVTENVMIGAGSVAIKDILKPGTYFGNPIRRLHG